MVREYNKYGKPKSYIMHDMLRDLCIRKSGEDKFLYVMNGSKVIFSNPRRIRFDTSKGLDDVKGSMEYMSLTRSVIGIGFGRNELPFGIFSASKLLRVLDVMGMEFAEFPTEIFESVNLRFLGVKCHSRIPKGISRLWNLQTLIGYCRFDAPCELWQLSELRNLKVYGFELLKNEEMNNCVMKKLQMISDTKITKEASTWDNFFKSIPNVKNLAINDEFRSASKEIDLSDLHNLEILRCSYMITVSVPFSSNCRSQVIFPCKIQKLVLFKCVINSGVLSTLCALHNLEVLRIRGCKFESEVGTCDAEWEAAGEDEFCSLQFLYLEWLPLVHLIANGTNFPRLRHLCLHGCSNLEEIPISIGEIPTLQLIDLQECTKQ